MVKKFIFAGKSSDEFGCFISGKSTYVKPERDVEFVDIPGRNGQLIIDKKRYKNTPYSLPLRIQGTDAKSKADQFSQFLKAQIGYKRLEDDYHPDCYRMAALIGGIEWEPFANQAMDTTLQFTLKPQAYLKSGEHQLTISSGTVLLNPTFYEALPLIRVVGTGTLTVGDQTLTVTAAGTNYIDLDSELQNAYEGTDNMNSNITGTLPVLYPGENGITFSGFSSVKITPRWWTI